MEESAREEAAFAMVDVFASVGADRFDVTLTDIQSNKIRFRPNQTLQEVKHKIPKALELAESEQHNIILRPRVSDKSVFFVQLDDLKSAQLLKARQAVLLTIETSPGNFQGWLAIASGSNIDEKHIASSLRRAIGADISASGATRIAGSHNFKEKYQPDYPIIAITQSRPGRVMTAQQLKEMALLPLPAYIPKSIPHYAWTPKKPGRFPDYGKCLQNAPANTKGDGPDTSRADFTWCMIALDWGWSMEETAAQLLQERTDSTKRHRNMQRYADMTVHSAAIALERNRTRGR